MKKWLAIGVLGLAASTAMAQIKVENAWVRSVVEGQKVTGAFMQMTSQESTRLVGADSTAAAHTEIHEMQMAGNVMKMRAIDSLDLPAGKMVELKPGSYHLMLFDLKKPLRPGDEIPLTLSFEGKDKTAKKLEIQIKVRDGFAPAAASMMHQH